MPIKHYECVLIINASLEDEQIDATFNRVKEFVTANGGDFKEIENWGRKRLAYPIQKSKSGYYIVSRFTAPTELISKLERNFRLDENIVRYITIALDKKAVAHYDELKKHAAEEVAKAAAEEAVKEEVTETTEEKTEEKSASEETSES